MLQKVDAYGDAENPVVKVLPYGAPLGQSAYYSGLTLTGTYEVETSANSWGDDDLRSIIRDRVRKIIQTA